MNILHNPEQRRFTLTQNGETAHVAYLIENGAFPLPSKDKASPRPLSRLPTTMPCSRVMPA